MAKNLLNQRYELHSHSPEKSIHSSTRNTRSRSSSPPTKELRKISPKILLLRLILKGRSIVSSHHKKLTFITISVSCIVFVFVCLIELNHQISVFGNDSNIRSSRRGVGINDLGSELGIHPRPKAIGALRNVNWHNHHSDWNPNTLLGRRQVSHSILHVHSVHGTLPRYESVSNKHEHDEHEHEHEHEHERSHRHERTHRRERTHQRSRTRTRTHQEDKGEFWELSGNTHQQQDEHEGIYQPYKDKPECKPMHEWYKESHPTCNIMHEQPLNDNTQSSPYQTKLLAKGWWRMTLRTMSQNEPIAFKTMRMDRPLVDFVVEKHRIDAVMYDHMTKSEHIIDIYGYCSFTGLFEYADGGYNLEDYLVDSKEGFELDKVGRLALALEVTEGLADLHSIDSRNGHSAFVHSDVIVNQYVMTNGKFKLNDFNRGHLMYWNTTSNESTCSYKCDIPNPGIQRAPEEIIYSDEQTESIDTWSLGHILHMILTNEYSFDESQIDMEDVQKLIMEGKRPKLSKKVRESSHPADRAIMKAIDMCLVQDWRRRYTSVEVRDYLAKELRKIK